MPVAPFPSRLCDSVGCIFLVLLAGRKCSLRLEHSPPCFPRPLCICPVKQHCPALHSNNTLTCVFSLLLVKQHCRNMFSLHSCPLCSSSHHLLRQPPHKEELRAFVLTGLDRRIPSHC